MERGRVGGFEEMKGKEGRNDRGRKGRLKSVAVTTTTVLYHMKACQCYYQLLW